MSHKIRRIVWLSILAVFIIGACAPAVDEATRSVELYLQALAQKDEDSLLAQICPEYESDALLEFDALQGVQTKLSELSCARVGGQDATAQVNCQGKLLASYQNEVQEFDLSGRTYQVERRDGDWLVCGY
ncbi:MAG: hypothetical protein VB089_03500 [Anaerolineaceae bacterium]|nr:hypothetical protein [Anaerolineaceae bacterium]